MKKLLYVTNIDINRSEDAGILKKVREQCFEFSKYYETILVCRKVKDIYLQNFNFNTETYIKDIYKPTSNNRHFLQKFIKCKNLNIFSNLFNRILVKEEPNIIYVRKNSLSLKGINFLNAFKEKFDAYVIYEMPTYPFKLEYIREKKYLSYILTKIYYEKMRKISNKVLVVLGKEIILDNDKFLPIYNGISTEDVNIKKINNKDDSLNLIGVANVSFWHGYDRVIEGLKIYYENNNKVKVYFHIVGEGEGLKQLIQLVEKYCLNRYVIFHGAKKGKDLNELIDLTHIGIGSLANHRKGFTKDSALKNREYCVRGIPFIIASQDDAFLNFKYCLKISQDEKPTDIYEILKFYNSIKNDNCAQEMRRFAEKNLTWEVTMKHVIAAIEEKK